MAAKQNNPEKVVQLARKREVIGGGWFVFRRGSTSGRVKPGLLPFEHGDQISAAQEAVRLAAQNPGTRFDVTRVVLSVNEVPDIPDAPQHLDEFAVA